MNYRDLDVWKKAHEITKEIYRTTAKFPKEELYGLTSQIRRAAVSVPTNIVEGNSRNTTKEYIQFLFNSRGSLEEVRYLLFLSKELSLIDKGIYSNLENKYEEISKMLNGLIKSLRNKTK